MIEPNSASATIQLWSCDEKGNKKTLLNMDIATPSTGKNTMQFKIPSKTSKYAARYPEGKYIINVGAADKMELARDRNFRSDYNSRIIICAGEHTLFKNNMYARVSVFCKISE